MQRAHVSIPLVATCVAFVGCVIASMCFMDSRWRRAWVARDVRAAVQRLRLDPGDSRALQSLMRLARSDYSFGAMAAVVGLGDMGEAARPVVSELAALMESPDPYVRREAANSLCKLGPVSAAALDDLARQVAKEPSTEVSWFAAGAIGANGEAALKYLPLLKSKLGTGAVQFDDALRRAIKAIESVEAQRSKPAPIDTRSSSQDSCSRVLCRKETRALKHSVGA